MPSAAKQHGATSWQLAFLAVLVIQVGVWAAVTHDMPTRFLAVAVVPMALLGGDLLARLSRVASVPFRKPMDSSGAPWGRAVAVVLVVLMAVVNLWTASGMLSNATAGPLASLRYYPGPQFAKEFGIAGLLGLPEGSKIAMLGNASVFYAPANTVYATAFDADGRRPIPLGGTPAQTLANLRAAGVTHVLVDWEEIYRLATTYGYPAAYVDDMFARMSQEQREVVVGADYGKIVEGDKIGLNWLDAMGLVAVQHIQGEDFGKKPATGSASAPASSPSTSHPDLGDLRQDHFHVRIRPGSARPIPMTVLSVYRVPPTKNE